MTHDKVSGTTDNSEGLGASEEPELHPIYGQPAARSPSGEASSEFRARYSLRNTRKEPLEPEKPRSILTTSKALRSAKIRVTNVRFDRHAACSVKAWLENRAFRQMIGVHRHTWHNCRARVS